MAVDAINRSQGIVLMVGGKTWLDDDGDECAGCGL